MLAKKLELQTETNRFLRRRLITLESKQRPKKMVVAGAETPRTVVSPELQETSEKRLRNVWLDISKVLFQWGRGGGGQDTTMVRLLGSGPSWPWFDSQPCKKIIVNFFAVVEANQL